MISVNFGKHAGQTVEALFWKDPGYVWWMKGEGMHISRRDIDAGEFDAICEKARNLKIPRPCVWCSKRGPRRPVARMFVTLHISGGAARFDFDCSECRPMGGSLSLALSPGFYTPDIFRNYDKTGARFLIEALKWQYFRDKSYRMTKKRIEAFWSTPGNFTV